MINLIIDLAAVNAFLLLEGPNVLCITSAEHLEEALPFFFAPPVAVGTHPANSLKFRKKLIITPSAVASRSRTRLGNFSHGVGGHVWELTRDSEHHNSRVCLSAMRQIARAFPRINAACTRGRIAAAEAAVVMRPQAA